MRLSFFLAAIVTVALAMVGCVPIQSPTETTPEAFLTLNLDAGNPLDPLLFSVNGGGPVDASTLGEDCVGFIPEDPTLTLNYQGDVDFVETFFYSDHNPTLVIQQPNGEYLCADNANEQLLDPVIEMQQPPQGRYNIWVGSQHPNDLIPGFLVLTTLPEVNIGTLRLGELVKRPSIPERLIEEKLGYSRDLLQTDVDAATGEALSPDNTPVSVDVTSEGTIHVSDLDLDIENCSGFFNSKPDFAFDWTGTTEELNLYFASDVDASLAIITPSDEILCVDDTETGANLNPLVTIGNPAEGRYGVFVGRIQLDAPITGQLTIDTNVDAAPPVLAPGQAPSEGGN